LSRHSGVNIETIRYYERIAFCQRRRELRADTASTMMRIADVWPSYGARAISGFPSTIRVIFWA